MSSDTFVIQVRDSSGRIIRPTVNRNWKLSTFLNNLAVSAGGAAVQSIGLNDFVYSAEKHGYKTLSELGFVPNIQVVAYVTLNGGNPNNLEL